MKQNISKWLVSAMFVGSVFGGYACKDDTTLDGAGKDIYLTISPENPSLTIGRDTVQLTCKVENVNGKLIKDATIKWSSDDESIAKIIDGDRLVGVAEGAGKSVVIRATLPNGRYATTRASVLKRQLSGVGLFFTQKTAVGEKMYLSPGSDQEILAIVNPSYLLTDNEVKWDTAGSGIVIEPVVLKPMTDEKNRNDQDRIDKLPEGGAWYKVRTGNTPQGEYLVRMMIGSLSRELKIKIGPSVIASLNNVGELEYKMALDREFKTLEGSSAMNVNSNEEIVVYAQVDPATDEALEQIKDDVLWTVDGGAGVIKSVAAEKDGDLFKFVAQVASGVSEGTFKVSCSLQERTVSKTLTVTNYAKQPFEGLSFSPEKITDLNVGEIRSVRLRVLPRSSTGVIMSELQKLGIANLVTYSKPGVVELVEDNGGFSLKGLSTGKTDIIITLRGKQIVWKDIQTIPSPLSLTIDDKTPNVIAIGDEVEWSVNLQMAGTDQPDWSRVLWTIKSGNAVSLVTNPAVGQKVRIKAVDQLASGVPMESIVVARYGKSDKMQERKITVVPQPENMVLSSQLYNLENSGIEVSGKRIGFVLDPKGDDKSPVSVVIEDAAGLAEKTYDAASSPISIGWRTGLTKQAKSGTIVVTKAGSKYNATFDLVLQFGNSQVKITGSIEGLQKV